MTIEIGLIFTAVACIIGVVGFISGQKSAAKKEGQDFGAFTAEIKTDIKHIKDDVSEVKAQNKVISEQYANIRTDVEVVKRDLKTAFTKIDDMKGK